MPVFKNLNDIEKYMNNILDKAINGEIALSKLCDDGFLSSCSDFRCIQDMLDAEEIDDLNILTESDKDAIIIKNTKFSLWKDFIEEAAKRYVKRELKKQGIELK